MPPAHRVLRSAALVSLLGVAGCAVGPDYHRPTTPAPAEFKEAAGWKAAAPADAADRGSWWEVFHDPQLSELETRAAASNQSLAQVVANYEQARQLARADRTTLFPVLSGSASGQRSKSPGRPASGGAPASASEPTSSYSASLSASWTPDFWGRVRRLNEADIASAQASAADLADARLSIQATLAQTYFQLRIADERIRLRQTAVDAYRRTLEIARNKYNVGIVARNDVISAQAQLDAARAQVIDAGIQRAQLEHAIAVLVGQTPAEFSLAPHAALDLAMPAVPPQMPSTLLERRPDIAAAERSVAAANARIGVQTAASFPALTLSADGGYTGSPLGELLRTPNRFWSLAAGLADTLFDFGRRGDQVAQTRAAYDASVAAYRGAVLRAFQEIEDELVSLRLLESEAQVQDAAVREAAEAAQIAMNEYRAGTTDYTTVATAQVTELNDRQTALTVFLNRMNSSVALIEALGGGWHSTDLPTAGDVIAGPTPAGGH